MNPILIYLFPGLMDVVLSAATFVSTVRAVDMGFSPPVVGGVITTWSTTYMVASLLAGRVVSRRNAAAVLISSCFATVALSGAFAFPPESWPCTC